ncbi:Protein of unknown function [Raineyella antarctica]|uniref:DUF2550 domain-containing protein n=1 Tax=Raineyella antarctica TaxID=1577474 RepID=A0A1G6GUL4_9ACTN|nr:DUF2550 family protein [Raineyella antarctica]SDB85563.1 Protein of unknown function [Raineyella antarctica]
MLLAILKLALVVLVVLAIPAVVLIVRRIWLLRADGAFDCSAKLDSATPGALWVSGVGRFRGEELWWYPDFGWSFVPKLRFPRDRTTALPSQALAEDHEDGEFAEYRVVPLRRQIGGGTAVWDLAMAPEAVTAVLSWLEAAPPGRGHRRRPELDAG